MKKKIVFITGGLKGIGLATTKKFISEKWLVASFDKDIQKSNIAGTKYYQVDVSNWKSVQQGFNKAFHDFSRIDCLVNNAGIFGYAKLPEYDEELIDRVIGVNEKGVYFCTKIILDKMKTGSIVNIGSTAAQIGSTDPVYAGTKAAVLGFTKAMAKALAPNIRVNAVSPGATNTDIMKNYNRQRVEQLKEMTLLKRLAEPEDIANSIYFLASDEAKHITGICLDVNGGYVLR